MIKAILFLLLGIWIGIAIGNFYGVEIFTSQFCNEPMDACAVDMEGCIDDMNACENQNITVGTDCFEIFSQCAYTLGRCEIIGRIGGCL